MDRRDCASVSSFDTESLGGRLITGSLMAGRGSGTSLNDEQWQHSVILNFRSAWPPSSRTSMNLEQPSSDVDLLFPKNSIRIKMPEKEHVPDTNSFLEGVKIDEDKIMTTCQQSRCSIIQSVRENGFKPPKLFLRRDLSIVPPEEATRICGDCKKVHPIYRP